MTCKDCIHFNDCLTEQQTRYYGKVCACSNVEKLCKYFKDKSRFIELPCKVGDTVYHIKDNEVVKRVILDFTYDGNLYVRLRPFTSYEYIIGKDVFLTKEEAEAKLRELQNE